MSASQPARKRLPVKPSVENLRKQAKRLSKSLDLPLAQTQHQLSNEYGCKSWAELMHVVEVMNRGADQLSNVKRTVEPLPAAVRARDVGKVRQILASGEFTQHDLDAGMAHAAWYGGDAPDVLAVRKELFDLLLDHSADPDGQYGSAYGPIIFGTGECTSVEGLQWLIDAGADVTFPPVDTKYGPTCPLSSWLGNYGRGSNPARHRGIELLLSRGAFVPPEVSPPILAIHRGDADGLAALLKDDPTLVHRRFPDMPYGNIPLHGATLLHCAAEFGEIACAELLLARGANPRLESGTRATPLHHAAGSGPIEMVELLLRHNAKEWQTDKHGKKPLDYARTGVANDKEKIAELLDRPVIRDPNFKAAVLAIQTGDVAGLRRLLAAHPNLVHDRAIEPDCYTPGYFKDPKLLWFIADNPNLIRPMPANTPELAEVIITAGTEPADIGYTLALVMTSDPVREANLLEPLVKLLMRYGATVNESSIHSTLGHRQRDAIALLLAAGLPMTPAIAAGMGDVASLVRLLPEASADEKFSALSMAVINNETDAARRCLEAGADPNGFSRVHVHATSAHQAALHDNVELLRLLVKHGADLNIKDTLWGGTPLGWAMHEKRTNAESYLRSLIVPPPDERSKSP